MTSIAPSSYDVSIVGAGPAGSSLAIRLATGGLKVLLVEQKQFPRPKLCGEFISPECLPHFAELKVLDEMSIAGGVEIARTVFYAQNGRSLAVPNEWFNAGPSALALSRAAMDSVLLSRARSAGTDVMENTYAAGLLTESDKVTGLMLRAEDRQTFEIKSKLIIDATGRARALVRYVEKSRDRVQRNRALFVAFKNHLRGAAVLDGDCEIYAYRGGYGGCVRVEKGLYNLCFIVPAERAKRYGSDAAEIMQKVVLRNKRAAESLANATIADEWLAVPIESYGRAQIAPAEGLLTVGDAAAFIDPFTGSGILLALESSKTLTDVLKVNFLRPFDEIAREYEIKYRSAFDHRLRVSSLLRHAAFVPFIAGSVIRGLGMSDRLSRTLARATRNF